MVHVKPHGLGRWSDNDDTDCILFETREIDVSEYTDGNAEAADTFRVDIEPNGDAVISISESDDGFYVMEDVTPLFDVEAIITALKEQNIPDWQDDYDDFEGDDEE